MDEAKKRRKGLDSECSAEYMRLYEARQLIHDRVSIDLRVVIIGMTMSWLIACLKGSSMNLKELG